MSRSGPDATGPATLTWDVPRGDWTVVAFWAGPTGQAPSLSAERVPGWLTDLFDAARVEATLEHLRAVARSGRTLLRKDDGPGNAMVAIQAAVVMSGRRRNPKVTTHIDVNIPPVTMPTYRLAQVVLNLVENARDAIGKRPDGRITVATRLGDAGDRMYGTK